MPAGKAFVFLWAGIVVLILFFWIYFPVLSRYRDLKINEEKLTQDIRVLNEKIKVLTDEKKLLRNDVSYIEKVIREEMGLVKTGEIVYKFVPDSPGFTEAAAVEPDAEALPAAGSEIFRQDTRKRRTAN